MKTERDSRPVGANLNHVDGGDGLRRPSLVIGRVAVRNQRAERVVAAGEIEDDEVAAGGALRAGEVGEKCRRGKTDSERRHAVTNELASSEFHGLVILARISDELIVPGPRQQMEQPRTLGQELRLRAGPVPPART